MLVRCKACGWESHNYQNEDELAITVRLLGGDMMMNYDEYGKPNGWEISCPSGCEGQYVELDYVTRV